MGGFLSGRTSLTTVQTADIANDAVTLAKMAAGTDGNVITYDTSGDPAVVATGTSGHFLKSAGAGAVPTFAADNKGAMTLVATVTASSAASADFDGSLSSTYDHYLMVGSNIHMDTDSTFLWVRCDTDGGDSFDAGSTSYAWSTAMKNAAAQTLEADLSDSEISLSGISGTYDWSNEATHAQAFTLWINGPSNATFLKTMHWNVSGFNTTTSPTIQVGFGVGAHLITAAYDSIQILPSSGTFDGTFRLYGIANS